MLLEPPSLLPTIFAALPGATTWQITEYLAAPDPWQGVLESWQMVACFGFASVSSEVLEAGIIFMEYGHSSDMVRHKQGRARSA